MTTRSSRRWRSKPGSFDALNASLLFGSDNRWGIPQLEHAALAAVPAWLAPYRTRIRSQQAVTDGAIHFFLDDYRFESVWRHPRKALRSLSTVGLALAPDFSLYRDWPLTLQLWNTYRSRWCARFWQQHGIGVIPTLSWSDADSYTFCFAGVPRHSVVAVSTVGVRLDDPLEYTLFTAGFEALIERLQPSRVLCYGPAPPACHRLVDVICYPTRWCGIRSARRASPLQSDNGRSR